MIGTEHILAVLRHRRLAIAMVLAPLLVLNLIAATLGASHAARASAFDDIVARSRCLTSPAATLPEKVPEMAPGKAPGKAPAKPGHHQPCPACATACITGCCATPALAGPHMSFAGPRLAAGLDAATLSGHSPVVPSQFRSFQRAQAPPQHRTSQSFNAS